MAESLDEAIIWNRKTDILPTDKALILSAKDDRLHASDMKWGFISSQDNKLLINARSETALQKPTFSESILNRRCIITGD